MKSNKQVNSGVSQGVQYAIAEDQALIGDTRHPLHHKPLPRRGGPTGTELLAVKPLVTEQRVSGVRGGQPDAEPTGKVTPGKYAFSKNEPADADEC